MRKPGPQSSPSKSKPLPSSPSYRLELPVNRIVSKAPNSPLKSDCQTSLRTTTTTLCGPDLIKAGLACTGVQGPGLVWKILGIIWNLFYIFHFHFSQWTHWTQWTEPLNSFFENQSKFSKWIVRSLVRLSTNKSKSLSLTHKIFCGRVITVLHKAEDELSCLTQNWARNGQTIIEDVDK